MRFLLPLVGCYFLLFTVTGYSAVNNYNGEFPFTEGNFLSTKIKTDFGQVDNFLRSNDNKQETSFLKIAPELFIQTQGSGNLFQLKANASYQTFDQFSDDNHYDFSLLSKFHLRFAESQKIFVSGYLADIYEYRGTGISLGEANTLAEGDTRRNGFINVGYLYGHKDSLARAKFLLGHRNFSYLTRKSITKSLAYDTNYAQGNFDYLITGKTYFSTKVQYERISYDKNQDLDRQQYLGLAGIKWESTELTQLHVLIGYQSASFANDTFKREDGFAWQLNMFWNPLERIRFNLSSGSEITDSYKIEKSVSVSNFYSFGLFYSFTDELTLTINSKIVNNDIVGEINTSKEENFEFKTNIDYQWRHWLSTYARFNYNTFDSSKLKHDFDLQAFSVGLEVIF